MLTKADFATFVLIREMDRAIKFYTKTLGGKLLQRAPGDMRDSWASVKIRKENFWLINPPGPKQKKPDLVFSTFIVKDLKAEVQSLQKKGVKFQRAEKMDNSSTIDGPIAKDAFGATAFFKDSEGNLLMLWQST